MYCVPVVYTLDRTAFAVHLLLDEETQIHISEIKQYEKAEVLYLCVRQQSLNKVLPLDSKTGRWALICDLPFIYLFF